MELNTQKMETSKAAQDFLAFLAVVFLLIFVRLWLSPGDQGGRFQRMSETNRIRHPRDPGGPGNVIGSGGRILAHNRPSFEALLVPEDLKGNPEVLPESVRC